MSPLSQKIASQRHNLMLFLKFGIVGGSGVLVNLLVTIVMNKLHGGDAHSDDALFMLGEAKFSFSMLVWIVAFLIANLTNFQLNRSWTFQSSKAAGWWKEFWPFLAVGSVAALVGMFIKVALKAPTSPFFLPEPWFHGGEGAGLQSREYWAQLIAIFLTLPINFIVNKLWTFRAVRGKQPGETTDLLVAPVVAPEVVSDDDATLGVVKDVDGTAPAARAFDGHEVHDTADVVERD